MKNKYAYSQVCLFHDTDGRPYFSPLEKASIEVGLKVNYFGTSILRESIKLFISGKLDLRAISFLIRSRIRAISLVFERCSFPVICLAPYDYRLIYFIPRILFQKDKVLFQTSWPFWGTYNVPRGIHLFNRLIFKRLYRYIMNRRNVTVVCVTKAVEDSLNGMGVKNTLVLSHASKIPILDNEKNIRNENEKLVVGFLGKLLPAKGISIFCEIAAHLHNQFDFRIAGSGIELDKVLYAQSLDHLTYVGKLNGIPSIQAYLDDLDILIVPSIMTRIKGRNTEWQELFGQVLVEAMSRGVVVLASPHIGPLSILSSGKDGIIVEAEANKIEKVLEDLDKNRHKLKLISDGAILSAQKFSMESVSAVWEALLTNE